MNFRRSILCSLGSHAGPIETAKAETERHDLAVRFVRCQRCGELAGLDVEPYADMERRIAGGIES